MNAPLFDTHQMVKRLMAAGFSDTQAETVTDVVREARQFDLENLATKTDIGAVRAEIGELKAELKADTAGLRAELKSEIADLRAELKAEIALLRTEMHVQGAKLTAQIADSRAETLRWIIGLAVAQAGLIVALMRFAPGH